MESHYYNVDVNWESSRKGMMCSPELNKKNGVCIEVATPPFGCMQSCPCR